jgi:hypothetical protein
MQCFFLAKIFPMYIVELDPPSFEEPSDALLTRSTKEEINECAYSGEARDRP